MVLTNLEFSKAQRLSVGLADCRINRIGKNAIKIYGNKKSLDDIKKVLKWKTLKKS